MNKEIIIDKKNNVRTIEHSDDKMFKNEKKHSKAKFILIFIFILIITFAIIFGIHIVKWQNLAKDMITNLPSQVVDIEGNVIAELGSSKKIENIAFRRYSRKLKKCICCNRRPTFL